MKLTSLHIPTGEQQHERMLKTPIPRLIMSLALPTTLSQLVTVIYNTADTYFVAQIDTSATAGVGVVLSMMSIIHAFGFGLGMGASSIISRRLGEKRDREAYLTASSAFVAAIVVGCVLLLSGILTLQPLMVLLGASPTSLGYACDYAGCILYAAPVMCASFVLNNILRAEGEAVFSMLGLCSGGLLNIALDPLFIFTFGLGVKGAALATALSQCVSFAVLIMPFLRGHSIVKLSPRYVSRRFGDYFAILRAGLPTICRQGMASLSGALLNNQARLYGDAAVAAMTVANKIYMFARCVVIGIGQGFQPVAGYNYGAGDKKRTREAFGFACLIGTGVCLLLAAAGGIFADSVIGWFRDDPAVIRIGGEALRLLCLVMPLMAYSTYVNQLYQSLGFQLQATLLAVCRQGIFFVPLVLLLPHLFGEMGIELTQPAADALTFLVSIPFQIYFFRKILPMPREKKKI